MSDQLTTAEVAALAGIAPRSLDRQRLRGTVPEPDGYLGRTPWWRTDTIDRWLATRRTVGRPRRDAE